MEEKENSLLNGLSVENSVDPTNTNLNDSLGNDTNKNLDVIKLNNLLCDEINKNQAQENHIETSFIKKSIVDHNSGNPSQDIEQDPNLIPNLIKKIEELYVEKLRKEYGSKFIENKFYKMNNIIRQIENKKVISTRDFIKIAQIAKEKGGFITNSYRKEFYKKAFKLEEGYINFISYEGNLFKNQNHEKNIFSCLEFQENYCFESSFKDKDVSEEYIKKKKKNEYIIEVDVKRTIANNYFKDEKAIYILKNKLTNFLKTFFRVNENFQYYQGFHDIAMYFYIIFYNYEHYAAQILHRVAEFTLKDYIVEKIHNFRFETVFKIINCLIDKKDKNISQFYKKLEYPLDPTFCLPWIITLFTHDIDDLFTTVRLLDYFIFCPASKIYDLVGELAVKELKQVFKSCGKDLDLLVYFY